MRTHKWGAPAVGVSARLPQALADQMDIDCAQYGATRTDILVYLVAEHYGYPLDSPFQAPAAEQLDLEAGQTSTAKTSTAKTRPRNTRAA